MSTNSTEAAFVVSWNFCAIRGNTVEELLDNLRNFNANEDVPDEIATFKAIVTGSDMSNAVGAVKAAAPGSTVIERSTSGPEEVKDKFGNEFVYNHPDAPEIEPGVTAVLKTWIDKNGKERTAWKHPKVGPKPSNAGGNTEFHVWA